ncbi:MAG: DUF3122 domain-containing protein [Chamaesiphon sp.]|nr:DUF3122 domain-containing protein [Chamaesiphon sp.]
MSPVDTPKQSIELPIFYTEIAKDFKLMRIFTIVLIGLNRFKIPPLSWLLTVCLCALLLIWSSLPAFAVVTQIEEYPGQMLYQSRQSLQDRAGKTWQAIAFKRIHPEGSEIVSLRLISFPGGAALDHTQPLTLTTSLGQTLTAQNISSDISQNTATPANVGEYDIKPTLAELPEEIPVELTVPTLDGKSVRLSVPAAAIQEWQTLVSP